MHLNVEGGAPSALLVGNRPGVILSSVVDDNYFKVWQGLILLEEYFEQLAGELAVFSFSLMLRLTETQQ